MRKFVVIHISGIHEVTVDFCGCPHARPHYAQLLDAGWWPSTPLEPRSAAPLSTLRTFRILNLQGKLPPTDIYRAMEQQTDGSGLHTTRDVRGAVITNKLLFIFFIFRV